MSSPEHSEHSDQEEQEEQEDRLEPELLKLEVAVFSGINAVRAQRLGANRIELNAPGSYEQGGLTPPLTELTSVTQDLEVPVRIMIRPRGPPADGSPDFIYSAQEFGDMLNAIDKFKGAKILNPVRGDAFVFGIMMIPDQESLEKYPEDKVAIDEVRCAQLLSYARPFGCIFHRAFDPIASSSRWTEGIDTLIDLGFKGLLTAGGIDPAPENVSHLERMCRYINNRMQLVIGGGLRQQNIAHMASRLSRYTDCSVWLHTASIVRTLTDHGDNKPVASYELDIDELNAIFKKLGLARTD